MGYVDSSNHEQWCFLLWISPIKCMKKYCEEKNCVKNCFGIFLLLYYCQFYCKKIRYTRTKNNNYWPFYVYSYFKACFVYWFQWSFLKLSIPWVYVILGQFVLYFLSKVKIVIDIQYRWNIWELNVQEDSTCTRIVTC